MIFLFLVDKLQVVNVSHLPRSANAAVSHSAAAAAYGRTHTSFLLAADDLHVTLLF